MRTQIAGGHRSGVSPLRPVRHQTHATETAIRKEALDHGIECLQGGIGVSAIFLGMAHAILSPRGQASANERNHVGGQVGRIDVSEPSRPHVARELFDAGDRIPNQDFAHVAQVLSGKWCPHVKVFDVASAAGT